MDENMDLNKQDMNMNENQLKNFMEAVENMDMNKQVFEKDNELESDTEDVLQEFTNPNVVIEEVTDCMKKPRATLYEQNETPGGSIYWEPHVQGIPIPVEGTWYDTVDEAIDMYSKYAEMGGFEFKKSGQRLTKSGVVTYKYIMCNREGVPKAYFVNSPLFGLMRTTSRSESENSFFKSFTSPGATLVGFMMSYESAMERQRYRQEALDYKTIKVAPKCETKLLIELHAARVYTRTIFLLVQTEIIQGCWTCTIQDLKINEGCETVIIRDKNPKNNTALNTKNEKEQEKKTGTVAEQ
ncbi:FAR1 DNA binding domain-containing protein [Tanacetum coccineum]